MEEPLYLEVRLESPPEAMQREEEEEVPVASTEATRTGSTLL